MTVETRRLEVSCWQAGCQRCKNLQLLWHPQATRVSLGLNLSITDPTRSCHLLWPLLP